MNLRDLSIRNLVREYHELTRKDREDLDGGKIAGISAGVVLFILAISVAVWIWAVIVIVKYWKVLPAWAKVVGILGVLPVVPLGPVVTLIVVYIAKSTGTGYPGGSSREHYRHYRR